MASTSLIMLVSYRAREIWKDLWAIRVEVIHSYKPSIAWEIIEPDFYERVNFTTNDLAGPGLRVS